MILRTQGKPTTCPLVDPLGSSQIRQTPTLTVENAVDMGFSPRITKREATRACFCSTFHSLTSRFFSRMVAEVFLETIPLIKEEWDTSIV